jgi:hypothetical protein
MKKQRSQKGINRAIWIAFPIAVAAVFILWFWWKDVTSDRKYRLAVLTPITLLEEAPQYYPKTNIEVGQILPGETVKVLRMGYGKDFRAWRVRGSKGQEGWFIENSENIRISMKSP